MFKRILDLFLQIADAVRERRRKRKEDKRLLELRIKNKQLTDAVSYERAKARAQLNAERAATIAGKQEGKRF